MFGTLIGIFLTSTGIIIGTDTVLLDSMMPRPPRVEKTCMPSQRSVAALEGWYGDGLYLHQHFLTVCRGLSRSTKPLSLEQQADTLIQQLQKKYRDHTGPFPAHAASLPPPGSTHVASVVVAGYDGTTPVVAVRELRWEKDRKDQWHLLAERVGKLSFEGCGAKFLGEDGVAAVLLDTSAHFDRDKRRPEVQAAITANRLWTEDNCFMSAFTAEEAKALYILAVRLTIDHGESFHVDNGAVGGRLHLLTIPTTGSIKKEVVDPEQYLK
jgi:hypothetical protein